MALSALSVGTLGVGVIALLGVLAVLTFLAIVFGVAAVLLFHRRRLLIIPRATLFIVDFLGVPIKHILWLFNIDEALTDKMTVELRNILYAKEYSKVEYSGRIMFLPQCLRNPKCPAPLNAEGIQCINCGRCGIGLLTDYATQLGWRVFIAPGSTMVKRMVAKYKPRAVLGVGCPMEVREGTAKMAAAGLPVQGVVLDRDGCVDTRVNVRKLVQALIKRDRAYRISDDPKALEVARKIEALWSDDKPSGVILKERIEKDVY